MRRGYGDLVELIQRIGGVEGDELRDFVARGMLMTVLAGMDAPSIDAPWARELCGGAMDDKLNATQPAAAAD